ncbi:hypothetical protein [Arsenicicoccus dermatophilus]|uniref:SCO4225 family membrane protein n=1 Tax=Arsenicicoccus dermatophilus TaxID=1076331 RepID=UPI001F4D20CD|nr:hypothetical protein [Arsenicicoccus dermatophilus]MCH8612953.1 hypothetical protein [Arsenicicoccus dermatophilus]
MSDLPPPARPGCERHVVRLLVGAYTLLVTGCWAVGVWDELFPDPDQVGASFAFVPLFLTTMPWSVLLPPLRSIPGLGEVPAWGHMTVVAVVGWAANVAVLGSLAWVAGRVRDLCAR